MGMRSKLTCDEVVQVLLVGNVYALHIQTCVQQALRQGGPMAVHPAKRPTKARTAELAKSTQVNIRVEPGQLATIDAAAEALGWNRTAFMLETAVQAAEAVLLDKRLFTVDNTTYQRFVDRLDAPPAANSRLHALLHSEAPWEA